MNHVADPPRVFVVLVAAASVLCRPRKVAGGVIVTGIPARRDTWIDGCTALSIAREPIVAGARKICRSDWITKGILVASSTRRAGIIRVLPRDCGVLYVT